MFIKDSQLLRRALQKYKWVIITTTVINESKLLRECKVCNERRGKEMGGKKLHVYVFELEIFFLCRVHVGKVSDDIIFSPFKPEQNPRWDASMPRAEFPRIMDHVAVL